MSILIGDGDGCSIGNQLQRFSGSKGINRNFKGEAEDLLNISFITQEFFKSIRKFLDEAKGKFRRKEKKKIEESKGKQKPQEGGGRKNTWKTDSRSRRFGFPPKSFLYNTRGKLIPIITPL